MSIAIGSFAPQSSDFYSRMIIRPKTTSPAPTPTTTTAPPPRGIPAPTTATVDPIIKVPLVQPVLLPAPDFGGGAAPAAPAPAPTTTSTGPTTGTQTGSTGSSDFSRLIDLIGSQYAAQDVNGNLAPVSFASESTGTDAAAPASNPMAAIIVAVVVIAGVYLYMKRKRKA